MKIKLDDGKEIKVYFQYDANWEKRRATKAIIKENEVELGVGVTYLGLSDTFNYRVGRKIALARALKDAKFDKDIRAEVWNKLFDRGMNK